MSVRLLLVPAEVLWFAGDAIGRVASAIDDVADLTRDAGHLACTGAGTLGAGLERLGGNEDRLSALECRLTAWRDSTEHAFKRHHDRVIRLERILSDQYGGADLDAIELGVSGDASPDDRLPVWKRVA